MADTLHLRCRSGTWYYVRRVPKLLVPIIGKEFIKHSLNTKDKAQAKKLRPLEDMRADAQFVAAENQLAQLSSPQIAIKTPSLDELIKRFAFNLRHIRRL
ncbi:MAG: hypothetical protein JJU08_17005 [Rhodobacteraceae bacterium]|nr:hypothetical protein [Paracoccaceae bacterium]